MSKKYPFRLWEDLNLMLSAVQTFSVSPRQTPWHCTAKSKDTGLKGGPRWMQRSLPGVEKGWAVRPCHFWNWRRTSKDGKRPKSELGNQPCNSPGVQKATDPGSAVGCLAPYSWWHFKEPARCTEVLLYAQSIHRCGGRKVSIQR